MSEKPMHRAARETGNDRRPVLGSVFDAPPAAELVTVSHGPYAERLPVGGLTVSQVRSRFRDRFDIDPASQAVVDGNDADDATIVQGGQVLHFVRRAGEKGAAA